LKAGSAEPKSHPEAPGAPSPRRLSASRLAVGALVVVVSARGF